MPTLLDTLLGHDDARPAVVAPGAPALSFGELRDRVLGLAGQLRRSGAGPGDRVATLLPNSPATAGVLLAAMGSCSAAPLNPRLTPDEVRASADDLGFRHLVMPAGTRPPEGLSADVQVLELAGDDRLWSLQASGRPLTVAAVTPSPPESEALVLQTSGTTARPKTVPLTGANLLASARNLGATLALEPGDVALAVMPQFHIHGIVASLVSPLAAGSAVAVPPGFDAFRFFDWLDELQPTWYSAVPTMHQLVLGRAARNAGAVERSRLRFVRSSSASLPPTVLAELETAFRAPVVEAYGMTEASHQMASNPLPPAVRKPGSVGFGVGVDVAVMDHAGTLLPAGETGEVVVRGPNVMSGYAANPAANASAFTDGWFRTGDQGVQDAGGYLVLTGRLKEIINRGGEKVAPREVEEVLLQHPAVAEAAVFAVPHATLGEDVGAAIVLAGDPLAEAAIREFLGEHLAAFKVPRRIVFLEALPLGPTGKVQRVGMAARLGLE